MTPPCRRGRGPPLGGREVAPSVGLKRAYRRPRKWGGRAWSAVGTNRPVKLSTTVTCAPWHGRVASWKAGRGRAEGRSTTKATTGRLASTERSPASATERWAASYLPHHGIITTKRLPVTISGSIACQHHTLKLSRILHHGQSQSQVPLL